MHCGSIGQVSYRDSHAPRRRKHAYSGISTLDFSLVLFVVRCLVFVSSSPRDHRRVRRVRCSCPLFASSFLVAAFLRSCHMSLSRVLFERRNPFSFLVARFVVGGMRSYIVGDRAQDNVRLSALEHVVLSYRCDSFSIIVVRFFSIRVSVCVWNGSLSFYRFIVSLVVLL